MKTVEMTIDEAINLTLMEEMSQHEDVIILGETVRPAEGYDVAPHGARSKGLYQRFGARRVILTPISEASSVGIAAGAAMTGLRVVFDGGISSFIQVALDQLVSIVAKSTYMTGGRASIPLILIATEGGLGMRMAAQHCSWLKGFLMNVQGIKIATPSTAYDARGLLMSAFREVDPVAFLVYGSPKMARDRVPLEHYYIPFGRADVKREGRDITIVAISGMVREALSAAQELSRLGVEAEVVDPMTLNPLDRATIIKSVQKTGRLLVVEEGNARAGVASEIAALVAEEGFSRLKAPLRRLTLPDSHVPFSAALEDLLLITAERITSTALQMVR